MKRKLFEKTLNTNHLLTDELGDPLTVYHGSPKDFEKFSYDFIGDSGSIYGYGFYFTESKEFAEHFGAVKSYNISIQKPLENKKISRSRQSIAKVLGYLAKIEDHILYDFSDKQEYNKEQAIREQVDMLFEYNDNDIDIFCELCNIFGSKKQVAEAYLELGVGDGTITKKPEGYHFFVTFTPEQIFKIK